MIFYENIKVSSVVREEMIQKNTKSIIFCDCALIFVVVREKSELRVDPTYLVHTTTGTLLVQVDTYS